jgi:glycosyltransferase involved in cell wall biosynthesis
MTLLSLIHGDFMFYKTIFFMLSLLILPLSGECANDAARPVEFVILVLSYNNEQWCIQNLESIANQTYPHWTMHYVNDCSSDRTGQMVEEFIREHKIEHKCTLVNNTMRKLAMANFYESVHSIDPEKVVVICDGDDWLANDSVLEKLAAIYSDGSIWMTYGNYRIWPNNGDSCCAVIPDNVREEKLFRSYNWVSSHLRTFYAKLFQQIKKEDFIGIDGEFFPMTCDLAMMFPMLEMASKQHYHFVSDIIYIYNCANPINDYKVNLKLQLTIDEYIRSLPPYEAIETLF